MELWPGFASSIVTTSLGHVLSLDVCHKVIRTDSVLDHLKELKRNSRSDDEWRRMAEELIGTRVLTR